jgi:hypothetical protein
VVVLSNGGIGAANVEMHLEHPVKVVKGSGYWMSAPWKGLGPGEYFDGLIPYPAGGQIKLTGNETRVVWVDVTIPRSFSGSSLEVKLSIGDHPITLKITVWKFALPVTPTMGSSFLYWTHRGELAPEQLLLKHRIQATYINPSDAVSLVAGGQSMASVGFWAGAENGKVLNPPPTLAAAKAAVAKYPSPANGWLNYSYCVDEYITAPQSVLDVMKKYRTVFDQASIKMLVTMPPKNGWEKIAHIFTVLPMQHDPADLAYVAQYVPGGQMWSYNTCFQGDKTLHWLLDSDPTNFVLQPGFLNYRLGYKGILYWRVDSYNADPWNVAEGTMGASYPGEGVLVYPGKGAPGGDLPDLFYASMRLKRIYRGMCHADYMAQAAKMGLETQALAITKGCGTSWTTFTRSDVTIISAQKALGQLISDNMPG